MKRSRLKRKGTSDTTKIKDEIQALLRQIVIIRDGGCVLRKIRHCNHPVLQADHLITRSNSATFGDSRLVVCLCKACHGGFKQWHKEKYDALVKTVLPKERVALWERCEQERSSHKANKMDWKLVKLSLEQELNEVSRLQGE